MKPIDVKTILERSANSSPDQRGISTMAKNLIGSEILKIAAEIRVMLAKGEKIEKKVYIPFQLVTPENVKDFVAKN